MADIPTSSAKQSLPVWLRKATRYAAGVVAVSLGAALGVKPGAGVSSVDAQAVTLATQLGAPYWVASWTMQGILAVAILALGGRFRLGPFRPRPPVRACHRVHPGRTPRSGRAGMVGAVCGGVYSHNRIRAVAVPGGGADLKDERPVLRSGSREVLHPRSPGQARIRGRPAGIRLAGRRTRRVGTAVVAFGVAPLLGVMQRTSTRIRERREGGAAVAEAAQAA